MASSPITYELDGRQYLMTGMGSVLYAWALPLPADKVGGTSLSDQ
jgi:alcohol dehydrogenase (cytochrome c)